MPHLLVTNDFPPKVGGIQTYLWELWRRLPPDETTVLTTAYEGAEAFDREQPFRVERIASKVMLPTPSLVRRINRLADEVAAKVVLLDPVVWPPIGVMGRALDRPYGLVLHGAEITVPARLPAARQALAAAVRGACHVISAGGYAAAEAAQAAGHERMPTTTIVPPGVDVDRFRPIDTADERRRVRASFGLPTDGVLVVGLSRLVPRKGFDVLIDAAAIVRERRPDVDLHVAIGGRGRDADRLRKRAAGSTSFLGRIPDDRLPGLYACADVFAMVCRNRWFGLEQEGFGIVFVEAAACGVPQLAGESGGAAEAVVDGETGLVVRRPDDATATARELERLVVDGDVRTAMGAAARRRAVERFSWDVLAADLASTIAALP